MDAKSSLDQHFLYTYSNVNHEPPSERMKEIFKDDLIFDKTRHSIHTQNEEFGYICNTTQTVTVRNADGTTSTDLTLDVQDGVITFSQYVPIQVKNFNVICSYSAGSTYSGNVSELGSSITVTQLQYTIHNSPAEEYVIKIGSNTVSKTAYTKIGGPYKFDISAGNVLTSNSVTSFSVSLIAYDKKENYSTQSVTKYFYNHIRILEVGNSTYSDYYKLFDEINTNGFSNVSANVVYDTLANTYTISNFNCNNGPSKYLCLHIPARLCSLNVITGVLGGASVQEFKRVKSLEFENNSKFKEDYSIYLATGENWKGFSLSIK